MSLSPAEIWEMCFVKLSTLVLYQALYEQDLLPRIISGSSVGSLVGALICVTPEDELEALLSDTPRLKSAHLITREGEDPTPWEKFKNLVK